MERRNRAGERIGRADQGVEAEVGVLDRLFEAGQADLTKLMQARQRLIQLENSQLDAVWQATQAQADLLLALGTPSLIHAMLNQRNAMMLRAAPAPCYRQARSSCAGRLRQPIPPPALIATPANVADP